MKFSTWGLTYQNACDLIDALKSAGIEAYITAGGVAIYADPPQINRMNAICKKFSATAVLGNTLHQELVLNKDAAMSWIEDRTGYKLDRNDSCSE